MLYLGMKKYLFTLLSLLIYFTANAQNVGPATPKPSVILDGKLLVNGMDTLRKFKNEDIESVTILKERDKTSQFGINDNNGLLIVFTKAKQNSAENIALKKKIAKLNFSAKPDLVMKSGTTNKPSRDSIPNGVFDFVSVEKQPEFPGGLKAFYQYLNDNIKYPKEAAKNKIQGRVFLSFIVEKNGALTNIKIMRGVSADINEEAIRVLSGSPKWNPGIQFGVPVRVKYNINVNFALN